MASWDLCLLPDPLGEGLAVNPGKPVERLRLRREKVFERSREVFSSGSSVTAVSGRPEDARLGGLEGDGDFAVSSSSSPHISSASVTRTVLRTCLVAPSTVSSFVVGVMGSLRRRAWCSAPMAASSSAFRESEDSSLSVSSTKPRPGASALCETAEGVCSSERRQERARTPERRMTVPRAMRHAWSTVRRSVCLK